MINYEKGVDRMGMTDSQFKGFIRFLLSALREMWNEKDPEQKKKKMDEIIENLQRTLED